MTVRPITACHHRFAWLLNISARASAGPLHVCSVVAGIMLAAVATSVLPAAAGTAHLPSSHDIFQVFEEDFGSSDDVLPGQQRDGQTGPNYSPYFDDDDMLQDPFTRRDEAPHDVPQGCPFNNKKKLELLV